MNRDASSSGELANADRLKQRLLRLEARHEPLLDTIGFAGRVAYACLASGMLVGASLAGGMVGYHFFEGMPWIDAFANAAMILSGMGPLEPLHSPAGKLFAGVYALFSGLVLVLATGLIFAPIFHRVLHRFHLETADDD